MIKTTDTSETATASAEALSAGAMIRAARETSGLHIAALAFSMKVPVKKLEALESDRFDLLLDSVFARALAASVCRTLKIDPLPVLDRLPQCAVPRLAGAQHQINAHYTASSYSQKIVFPQIFAKPSMVLVSVLLLAAAYLVFSPVSAVLDKPEESTQLDVVPSVINTNAEEALRSSEISISPMGGGLAVPITANGADLTNSVALPLEPQDVVTFKTRGISWVEVTDAKGVVQLRKSMVAGESVSTSGAIPLSVVVGKANLTDVTFRGKLLAIGDLAKDNVARFEVK